MPMLFLLLLLGAGDPPEAVQKILDAEQAVRPAPKPDAAAIKLEWHPSILDAGKEVAAAGRQVVATGRQIEKTAVQIERTGAAVEKLATASERAITVATDYGPMVFVVCACLVATGLVVLWGRRKGAAVAALLLTLTLASGCIESRPPPRHCPRGHRECRCGCERGERCNCHWRNGEVAK